MKTFLTFIFLAASVELCLGQLSAASVQNGNFLSPSTWDCNCIPLPGYNITINHTVTLDTNQVFYGDSFTINSSGALKESTSTQNYLIGRVDSSKAGIFTNNGFFDISHFTNGGFHIFNNDTFRVNSYLSTFAYFTNNGVILDVDTLFTASLFINNLNAAVYSGLFQNAEGVKNYGLISCNDFISGYLTENYGTITVANDFTSSGSLPGGFLNEGFISIGNNFSNSGNNMSGDSGIFCVSGSSTNSGDMAGTFGFCDYSPLSPPALIDINTGFFDSNIVANCIACQVGVKEQSTTSVGFQVYPNPNTGKFFLEMYLQEYTRVSVKFFQFTGQLIHSSEINKITGNFIQEIDISGYSKGIYFVQISTDYNILTRKVVIY